MDTHVTGRTSVRFCASVAAHLVLAGVGMGAVRADEPPRASAPAAGAIAGVEAIPALASDMPAALSSANPSSGMFSLPDGIRLRIGAVGLMQPKFEGSKSYEFLALPVFEFAPLGGPSGPGASSAFDVRNLDDLSVAIARVDGFEFGPLAGYRVGRSASDSPRLKGFDDIDGGIVAGAFAKYTFGPFYARASYHQHVTGSETGALLRLAAGTVYPVADKVLVKAGAVIDFADSDYMAAYFGVTPTQAARSGLRAFDAGSGLKSVGATLATEYALTPDWTLLASAGYTRLVGSAADSPIVETADRLEFRLGASRAVDWRFK